MKQRLLVLAAGPLQLPAIHVARRLGIEVIALDGDPSAPGLGLADSARVVNILDVEACLKVAREVRPDGVIHICSEVAMPALGAINDELCLKGPGRTTVMNATNKEAMRRAFAAAGAPSPRCHGICTEAEALSAARDFVGPVIVKPARNSGSRGVSRVDDPRDESAVVAAFRRAFTESRDPAAVIEEFIDGPEFSVEILVWHGVERVLAVTDKQTTGSPYFVETGHSQPTRLPAAARQKVVVAALQGVRALGITWSAAHAEVKLSPTGPFLVEIGARLGGDFITTELVPRSTGIDMVAAAVRLALGEVPDLTPLHLPQGAAIRYLRPKPGRVRTILGAVEAASMPGVRVVNVSVKAGDIVPPITSSLSRVGHVIAEGRNVEEAVDNAEAARNAIRIETTP